MERIARFRNSDQYIRHRDRTHEFPLAVQRLAHWLCDAIHRSYEAVDHAPSLRLRDITADFVFHLMLGALSWVSSFGVD